MIGLISLAIVVIGQTVAFVWWCAKLDTSVFNMADSLTRIDKELEKRDNSINAIGSKLDSLRERVIILEHHGK